MLNEQSQHEKPVEYDEVFFYFIYIASIYKYLVVRRKEKLMWDLVLYSLNLKQEKT